MVKSTLYTLSTTEVQILDPKSAIRRFRDTRLSKIAEKGMHHMTQE